VETNLRKAIAEQTSVKGEFQKAFTENLICKGFDRNEINPKYLLYKEK
jgi:hypothetical protein